jgi:hypothetical protein
MNAVNLRTPGVYSSPAMQLFPSATMYVFTFCIFALFLAAKLHRVIYGQVQASITGLGINDIVLALITICIAVYLVGLLSKLTSRIEQVAVVLYLVSCILWLVNLLAKVGIAWAAIPHTPVVSAAIDSSITVLAGVRTLQVLFNRKPAQGT